MNEETHMLFAAAETHWHRLADGAPGGLPQAADLRPEEMAAWMPYTMLAEFDAAAFDFRFRLVGTRVCAFYGHEFTGRHLTRLPFALDRDNFDTFWTWWFRVEWTVPGRDVAAHLLAPDRIVPVDRLILPYRGDGEGARRLMVVQRPRIAACAGWPALRRPAGERGIERREHPRPAVNCPSAA